MDYKPLIFAVLAGILYGALRSAMIQQKEESKRRGNPYTESIVLSLVVYLLLSSFVFK
ncbi:MAG: hypothetical protein ACI35R_04680 [Bacillus sp. (in: firmicutes)]